MKKSLIKYLFPLIFTLAVTDYLWVEILQDDQTAVELELEKDLEEEISKTKEGESKIDHFFTARIPTQFEFNITVFSGFVNLGNSFLVITQSFPKLYLLYQQIKVYC